MMLDKLDDDSEQEDGGLGAGEGDDGKGRTSLVMMLVNIDDAGQSCSDSGVKRWVPSWPRLLLHSCTWHGDCVLHYPQGCWVRVPS